jgi:soluble lytic murein transglycosylase-like protein
VSLASVLKTNRLGADAVIHVGDRVRIRGARAVARAKPAKPAAVPDTFLGVTYPTSVARAAARNRAVLAARDVPSRAEVKALVTQTARRHGVDVRLALAVSFQESGWNQRQVSVANAIGTMQVIPSSGQWASTLVGRRLNLLDAEDNITAGVVILKALTTSAGRVDHAIAGYYQGLASVRSRGMHADTRQYVRSVLALKRQFA